MEKVDLRSYPYRGILTEMSEELGIPIDRIYKALFYRKNPHPEYAEMFQHKLEERKKVIRNFKRSIRKAV